MQFLCSHDAISVVYYKLLLQIGIELALNSTNVVGDFILGVNIQFHNFSQLLINSLLKNSHTMYSDCLAVYRVLTMADNYNYSL